MTHLYIVLIALLTIVFFLRMAADLLTPSAIRTFFYSKLILAALLMVICLEAILLSRGIVSRVGRVGGVEVEALFFFGGLFALYFFAIFWAGQVSAYNAQRQKYFILTEGYTPTLIYVIVLTFSMTSLVYIS